LKQGYRTIWADLYSPQLSDSPTLPRLTITNHSLLRIAVEAYLKEGDWKYNRIDDQLIKLTIQGEEAEWATLIRIDEELRLCVVYSIYPVSVPASIRSNVADLLIHSNYDLAFGNFEMDMDDGEVRFRTSLDLENCDFQIEQFGQMFLSNLSIMDNHYKWLDNHVKNDD
jgi:hypothetical protein